MSLDERTGQLQAALDALAPVGCVGMASRIDSEASGGLSSEENALTASWAPHRRDEFATGRMCARQALEAVGAESGGLLPDGDGVPVWPEGFLGSISHSRGMAMAVAASKDSISLIGLDLEKTNRLSDAAMRRVLHSSEADFAACDQAKTSILFSLKEAFYKAQFPRWRTTGNFQDLALAVDVEAGTARVLAMDERFAAELKDLRFAFRIVENYVLSLAWSLPS